MAYKHDFEQLRQQVPIEKVADWLGIVVKGNGTSPRGECPFCSATRDFTITPSKGLWGCFKCSKKGTILDLVMHVKDVKLTEAARLIEEQFLGREQSQRDSTVPARTDDERLARVADRLDPEHPGVDAVGFDTEFAKEHGIGFSSTGAGKGYVLVPLRDRTGRLLGYIGTQEELWLPADFKPNVVPLKRPA